MIANDDLASLMKVCKGDNALHLDELINELNRREVKAELLAATVADNARLRALVKAKEWAIWVQNSSECPWCGRDGPEAGRVERHADDCPAFTPSGEVK